MSAVLRKVALVTPLLVAGAGAHAQGPVAGADVAPVAKRCLVGSTALRATTGGLIGTWIGLVTHKIAVSDWNDVSHTAEGHRALNRSMFIGAASGAVLGALIHVNQPCGGDSPMMQKARLGREPLYMAEITRAGLTGTVYDAVFALRRNWLNLRGVQALTEGPETLVLAKDTITVTGAPRLTVYLDNAKLGSIDELRTLPIVGITSVRYYEPAEATMRWGPGNTHGAIQVLTTEP